MNTLSRRHWLRSGLMAGAGIVSPAFLPSSSGLWKDFGYENDNALPLHWNENPYGASPKAVAAMTDHLTQTHRYPDDLVDRLKQAIAGRYHLSSDQVLITAGSTEALCLLGQFVGLVKGEILTPWPSFPTMILFGQRTGARIQKIPLNQNDQIDLQRLYDAVSPETKLVFICNPNNPTSTEVDRGQLIDFCKNVSENTVICIDEAYIQFSSRGEANSLVSLAVDLPNVVVCRTFSKVYGLAGMRIGYAVSSPALVRALEQRHTAMQLATSTLSLVAANAAMTDETFIRSCVIKNEEGRQIVYDAFNQWDIAHAPSSTNFIYAASNRFKPNVVAALLKDGIRITKWPDMHNHIRISIGKPAHMATFVNRIKSYLV